VTYGLCPHKKRRSACTECKVAAAEIVPKAPTTPVGSAPSIS
jgi:hypothetical protein